MSREDNTTQIKHSRLEDVHTDLGAEAARLLFAHVDPSTPAEGHADRARDIYDRLRKLAAASVDSSALARARADTMEAVFKPGESGVSRRVR